MFFLQLRHLVLRLFYALLIHCSSLFACPLLVSHLSCATLSPFGISFLRLWSLALRCLLFSVPSAKLLLLTSLLMALPEFGILLLYCKSQCKINYVFFFLSLVRSLSLCLLRRVPWLAPGYWTILIKQIVSIKKKNNNKKKGKIVHNFPMDFNRKKSHRTSSLFHP